MCLVSEARLFFCGFRFSSTFHGIDIMYHNLYRKHAMSRHTYFEPNTHTHTDKHYKLPERNGTERNGTERNGTERNGTERNVFEKVIIDSLKIERPRSIETKKKSY